MKNPWTKRNPFMSMWLSGANAVTGSARSRAIAEGKRQTAIIMKEGSKQIADFWSGAFLLAPTKKKKRRKAR